MRLPEGTFSTRQGNVIRLERLLDEAEQRALAIVNGTLAGAIGLGLRLWLVGLCLWAIGHALSVWAARHDPQFVDVARRHLKYPVWMRP